MRHISTSTKAAVNTSANHEANIRDAPLWGQFQPSLRELPPFPFAQGFGEQVANGYRSATADKMADKLSFHPFNSNK